MGELGEIRPYAGLNEPRRSLKELRTSAISAARKLMLQDVGLFASLGHVDDVSAETTGTPLVKGLYNVRLPIETMNPAALSLVKVIYIACADKRLTEAHTQLADEFAGGNTSQVLPVLLAGGVVQPGPEEIETTHLNTAFTEGASREPLLWDVVDYLVEARLAHNSTDPLTVIYGAHDGKCAFLAEIFDGIVDQRVAPEIIREVQEVHRLKDAESALVTDTIVSHASTHELPVGVNKKLRLFSLTQRKGNIWELETRPIKTGHQNPRRRMSALRPPSN